MTVMPTIVLDATMTERGQITVPSAIRKMLGVQSGPVVFKGMPDGSVIIESKKDEDSEDPVLAQFLAFLASDLAQNPQVLQPLTKAFLAEGQDLVGRVDVNLNEPLSDD